MLPRLGSCTASGHISTLLFIEPGVRHAIHHMKAAQNCGRRSITVKTEIRSAHNEILQKRLKGSVWSQDHSWYRTEGGRIAALFPGFTSEYLNAVRKPNLSV